MTTLTASILAGAWVGLSIAAPIGPASMLCVQRTIALGLRSGLATGCGVATVHLVYGALTIAFGSALIQTSFGSTFLSLSCALVLLGFSIRVLRRAVVIDGDIGKRLSLASTYLGAIGFSLLNPITPILFAAAMPTLLQQGPASIPIVVAGVFLGSLGWWFVLSTGVALLRERLTSRALNLVNKATGLLLAALALTMIVRLY